MPTLTEPNEADFTGIEEEQGSPKVSGNGDGVSTQRIFLGPKDEINALAVNLVGGISDIITEENQQTTVVYRLAAADPEYPQAIAQSFQIASMGGIAECEVGGITPSYEKYRLTVSYSSVGASQETDESGDPIGNDAMTLYEESIVPTAEVVVMPSKGIYWDAARKERLETDEAPQRVNRGLDYTITIKGVASLPQDVLGSIGNTNVAAVVSKTLGWTFGAETLLFTAADAKRIVTTFGAQAWTVTYKFAYKPTGWNKFLKAGEATPQTVYDAAGNPFETYDKVSFGIF